MRISDWSSDVCSSDLRAAAASRFHALGLSPRAGGGVAEIAGAEEGVELLRDAGEIGGHAAADAFGHAGIDGGDEAPRDRGRKSVVLGKSASGRVSLGGRRSMQNNKIREEQTDD